MLWLPNSLSWSLVDWSVHWFIRHLFVFYSWSGTKSRDVVPTWGFSLRAVGRQTYTRLSLQQELCAHRSALLEPRSRLGRVSEPNEPALRKGAKASQMLRAGSGRCVSSSVHSNKGHLRVNIPVNLCPGLISLALPSFSSAAKTLPNKTEELAEDNLEKNMSQARHSDAHL